MKTDFAVNVTRAEAIRRYALGVALIAAVLMSPAVPSWIALLACYPIFTAMIQWDPLNALFQLAVKNFSKDVSDVMFRKSTAA